MNIVLNKEENEILLGLNKDTSLTVFKQTR